MTRLVRWAVLGCVLLGAGLSLGCPSGEHADPMDPDPVTGTLEVRLVSAPEGTRALLLSVTGPDAPTNFATASSSYFVYARAVEGRTGVAVFGTFEAGPLLTFVVPDVETAASYAVSVVEIADTENAVTEAPTEVELSVAPR